MSGTSQLQTILDHIDTDFDNSLNRLFALLRIKSISADPAFAGECKAAADHLDSRYRDAEICRGGAPDGWPSRDRRQKQRQHRVAAACPILWPLRVQPVDPLNLSHRPPFEPVVTGHADGRKIIVARGAEDDKGQLMTLVEACRAWMSVTGSLPLDVTILIEGEEEIGSKHFVAFP